MNQMDVKRSGRVDEVVTTSRTSGTVDRSRSIARIALLSGLGMLFLEGPLAADDAGVSGLARETDRSAPSTARAPARGGMIPRDAIVDMTRAQSDVICSSEVFLGCMGFDGRTCQSLSESAIDQCLMTLPPQIDPTELDNASLESCPKSVYEKAGFDEAKANDCFEKALDES